jgi:hypothetical protein
MGVPCEFERLAIFPVFPKKLFRPLHCGCLENVKKCRKPGIFLARAPDINALRTWRCQSKLSTGKDGSNNYGGPALIVCPGTSWILVMMGFRGVTTAEKALYQLDVFRRCFETKHPKLIKGCVDLSKDVGLSRGLTFRVTKILRTTHSRQWIGIIIASKCDFGQGRALSYLSSLPSAGFCTYSASSRGSGPNGDLNRCRIRKEKKAEAIS